MKTVALGTSSPSITRFIPTVVCPKSAQLGHVKEDCQHGELRVCIKCGGLDHGIDDCFKYHMKVGTKAKIECVNCVLRGETVGTAHMASAIFFPYRLDFMYAKVAEST